MSFLPSLQYSLDPGFPKLVSEKIWMLPAQPSEMATVTDVRESVVINVPAENASATARRFKGKIEEFANKQLILHADEEIDASAEITAQSKDLLFMGTVLKCLADPDARWAIHVNVRRTILVI